MARPKSPKPRKNPVTGRGRKTVPWRDDPEILRRLPEVEELVLAGYPNTAIAATLKLSEATIRRDKDRIAELWQELTAGEIEIKRGRSISNLRRLQRLADNEFRSDQDKTVNLRLQMDAEKVVIELEGTKTPIEQTLKVKVERPIQPISSAELLRRAELIEQMARQLLEKPADSAPDP